jgi:tetratricopeptide (TPR) repeat protein/pimeloyl-ACP methyl ester carboxylesterase
LYYYGVINLNKKLLTSESLLMPKEEDRLNNFWYVCNDSKIAVVFLHGIFSNSRTCWLFKDSGSERRVFWPDLVYSDKRLGAPSIYLAGYYTAIDSGEFGIEQCANEVFEALRRQDADGNPPVLEREEIVFVCHSTGGIVARYMIERHKDVFRDKGIGLVLMASPSRGSVWGDVASLAARYYNQKLGYQLQWRGDALEDIHSRFCDLVDEKQKYMPCLFGTEACESEIIFRKKIPKWLRWLLPKRLKVVNTISAGQYFGAVTTIAPSDHFSIVKPSKLTDKSHEFLVNFMIDFEKKMKKCSPPLLPPPPIKVINTAPMVARGYFQDRDEETRMLSDFLRDESQRLFIVTGGSGMGKTTMVCRLLSSIVKEQDLDGIQRVKLDGVVYLSANGNRPINTQNLLIDLSKLLPADEVGGLDVLFSSPQIRSWDKMQALLCKFSQGCATVLLDNFEDLLVIDDKKNEFPIRDLELDEALRALLDATQHTVKLILTTTYAPVQLMLYQPGKQSTVTLEKGLSRSDAEIVLRKMDKGDQLGLKSWPIEFFDKAFELTEGHPKALEILHVILLADSNTTLDDLLQNNRQKLSLQVAEVLVGEAFDRQDSKNQYVLMALAIYGRPVSVAAVNELIRTHLPGVDSGSVLRSLVKLRLVLNKAGRYYLHPIDRFYALSKIPRGEYLDRLESDSPKFTQLALLHGGAEFFKRNRKPREAWQTFEDITPQLVEFDLRYEEGNYETAARLLIEIDNDYLTLWGHSPMVVDLYERLLGNLANSRLQAKCWINDPWLRQRCLYGLGFAQYYLGRCKAATDSMAASLVIAQDLGDNKAQGACLAYLGSCNFYFGSISNALENQRDALKFAAEMENSEPEKFRLCLLANGRLGTCFIFTADDTRAKEHLELALKSARGANDRRNENFFLDALGLVYCYQGRYDEAFKLLDQARGIAREIGDCYGLSMHACNHAEAFNIRGEPGDHDKAKSFAEEALQVGYGSLSPAIGSWGNVELAHARLRQGDIQGAYDAASAACKRDAPLNNPVAFAVLGIMALRLKDHHDEARTAFEKSIELADQLLNLCAQNYYALEAKGLALSGLVLSGDMDLKEKAVQTYQKSRRLSEAPGRLRRSRFLFEALPDPTNLLNEIRQAAVGG